MLGSCQNMHAPSYVCVRDVKEKMIHSSSWTAVIQNDLSMTTWMTSSSMTSSIMSSWTVSVAMFYNHYWHRHQIQPFLDHWSLVPDRVQLMSSAYHPILPGQEYKQTDRHQIWRFNPVLIIHHLHPVQHTQILFPTLPGAAIKIPQ